MTFTYVFVNWILYLTDMAVIKKAEQYEENKKIFNINDGRDSFSSIHRMNSSHMPQPVYRLGLPTL